jgi:mannitol-1-phosphate/altronate dehydrogenase
MKTIISLLIILTSVSCVSQKKPQENSIKEVVFNAQTRGALENITLKGVNIEYKTYSDTKSIVIDEKQKNKLFDLINAVDLNEISTFKASSENRASDRAMHATLSIKTDKGVFTSNQFDDNNPPEELKKIIELLRSYVD